MSQELSLHQHCCRNLKYRVEIRYRDKWSWDWLKHCATSRKVVGSIPNGVMGIPHWHKPAGLAMSLGSTQPLTKMNTRNISWCVKEVGASGWQPYRLNVPTVMKSGILNLLEHSAHEEGLQKKSVTIRKENILIMHDSSLVTGTLGLKKKKEYKHRENCL